MLKNICCCICYSLNKKTINIYETELQYVYENLTNSKISNDECWMCYICHTRLRQCHQLQQLAVQTHGLNDDTLGDTQDENVEHKKWTIISYTATSISNINQNLKVKMEVFSDNEIEEDTTLENEYGEEVQATVSKESIAGIKEELSNVDDFDEQQILNSEKINIDNLQLSVIDKCLYPRQTANSATEVCHSWEGQSTENVEIKQEIEDKGIKDYEQNNTSIANEAQSGDKDHFSCDVCFKNFSWKSELKVHIKSHSGEKPFSCDICSKKFTRKGCLNNHIQKHTGTDKPFVCDVCAKKFSQKRLLKVHLVTHTGNKMYSCDVCSKKFLRKSDINRHYLSHTGEKAHSCDICSKKFSRKNSLNIHKRIHMGTVKTFDCNVCLKKFSQKCHLNAHTLIHFGYKPFCCDICSKTFTRRSSLTVHLRIHTGTIVKSFSCDICPKKFSQNSHLKAHALTHKDDKMFTCDICSKKFLLKCNLRGHILTHSAKKPFNCDVCLKKFRRKSDLNVHKRVHIGYKPYRCDFCPKKFTHRTNLNSHIITHSTKKSYKYVKIIS